MEQRVEIAELLIQVNPNCVNFQQPTFGNTPLMIACQIGNRKLVNLLLDNRCQNILSANKKGYNVLMFASIHGRCEIIDILFQFLIDNKYSWDVIL